MWSDWYNYVAIPCVALRGNVESLWALEWKMSGQRRAAADVTEGKDFHHHLKHPQILSLMQWTKNSGLSVKSPLLTDHHFWTIQTLTADIVRKWNNRPGQVWNTKTVMVKNSLSWNSSEKWDSRNRKTQPVQEEEDEGKKEIRWQESMWSGQRNDRVILEQSSKKLRGSAGPVVPPSSLPSADNLGRLMSFREHF